MYLTRNQLFNHIRLQKYPLWNLYLHKGFERPHVAAYNGADFTESEANEAKMQKSMSFLSQNLNNFPADYVFTIKLRTSEKASQNGVIEGIDFINNDNETKEIVQPTVNGLGSVPSGYVSLSEIENRIELALKNERLNYREKETERKEKELEKKLGEVELERNSTISKFEPYAEILIKKTLGLFGVDFGDNQPAQEPANVTIESPQNAIGEVDENAVIVEDIAHTIYNSGLSANEMKGLKAHLDKLLLQAQQAKQPKQQTTEQNGISETE